MFVRLKSVSALAALALAAGIAAAPAHAQKTSVAERAQKLAKLEEDMASADPNLRIAAFESAMYDGSLGEKQRALVLAMASSDSALKAMGLRYKICASPIITIEYDQSSAPNGRNVFPILTGLLSLAVSQCSVADGKLTFAMEGGDRRSASIGHGAINGLRLDLNLTYVGALTITCSASFSPGPGQTLVGRIACRNGGSAFGPVPATIR